MICASVKGRYAADDDSGSVSSVAVDAGELKVRASLADATLAKGPSFSGLSLSLEKPGSFVIDYNVPKNDVKFQFMDEVRVLGRPLSLAYAHVWREKRTAIDGTLVLDPANKFSANYAFDSGNCRLKYSYRHRGNTSIEPSYDLASNSWDFSISQRFSSEDVLRASYQMSSKNLGMEWLRAAKFNTFGAFKLAASLNLAEELKFPRLSAETTWDFDI